MDFHSYKVKDGDGFCYILLERRVEIYGTTKLQSPFNETTIQERALDFDESIRPIVATAKSLLNAIKKASPDKVTIDFGVDIPYSEKSPLITKNGEGAFKIQLTWESKPKKTIRKP